MNDFCARAKEILQQGDSMLAAAKSRIGPISADSYLYMYAYHVFREDHSILGFVTLMEKADLLRNEINEALLAILRANPEQLERSDNISTIKALSRMRTELDAMKRKASVQSLAEFVDQVTNEGSILNLVGCIEKLRYERVYGNASAERLNILDLHLIDLEAVVDALHGNGTYAKIELFRARCAGHFMLKNYKCVFDETLSLRMYARFMRILKKGVDRKIFSCSASQCDQMAKQIIASHILSEDFLM